MKTFKYLLIGTALLGMSAPTMAQMDQTTAINELTKVVKSTADAKQKESQIKDLLKPFKKDPKVLTSVGRAYLDIKDQENAVRYADMALSRDKKYGDAYVLKGDAAASLDNGGEASAWFEQAVLAEPTNPNGYRRYAQVNSKVNPAGAVAKLEELRAAVPNYPVDIISAEIYDKAGNLDKAIEYYDKVSLDKMEDYQLASYGTDLFLKNNFEKSLQVAQYGAGKFPRNAGLNRLMFFNNTNLKNYTPALEAADKLFNASDSAKISEHDYLYLGYANMGAEKYDEAITAFNKCLETATDESSNRTDALKNLAEAYQKNGDFNNGVATYEKYLNVKKDRTANDFNSLAQMYVTESEKYEGDSKRELIMKADAVYADMVEKFPSVADFSTVQRAHLAFTLDPESKEGLAKPHYEKLIEIIKAKTEKGDRDNARLLESYRYLGAYYLITLDDAEAAKPYWESILEIDPENSIAKQALGIE